MQMPRSLGITGKKDYIDILEKKAVKVFPHIIQEKEK